MMKLVDILARELKSWPEGFDRIHGYIWKTFYIVKYDETPWFDESVTQKEWQAAVEALKSPNAVEWTGEGQPPVGTTCERRFHDVEGSSWMGCIILAHGFKRIFYRDNCGDEFAHSLDEVQFRAFRTAEQIAAEEREKDIDDMVSTALHQSYVITPAQAKIVFERIYDAGYRKQEQK